MFTLISSFLRHGIIEIIDSWRWRIYPRRSLYRLKITERNYSQCKQSVFLSKVISYVNGLDRALVRRRRGRRAYVNLWASVGKINSWQIAHWTYLEVFPKMLTRGIQTRNCSTLQFVFFIYLKISKFINIMNLIN